MFGLGYQELLIILLIVLLLFGGKKLPEVARGLGKALREFKHARDDLGDAIRREEENAGKPDVKEGDKLVEPPPLASRESNEPPTKT